MYINLYVCMHTHTHQKMQIPMERDVTCFLALSLLYLDLGSLDVYTDNHPLCTLASPPPPLLLLFPEPNTSRAETKPKSKSFIHSITCSVPRHATATSRRPIAAAP